MPRLRCRRRFWRHVLRELRERGGGRRESGGFLLGKQHGSEAVLSAFLPYDAIDPKALRGAILFDGSRMDQVWAECRRLGLDVIADVHTHPAGFGQSGIDQANPMMPERGHVALIVPNFADGLYLPGSIGIYEFRGAGKWIDHSPSGSSFFKIDGWLW